MTSPTLSPPRRFRFGLRSLFVVMTVAAVGISAWQLILRRQHFLSRAEKHAVDGFLDMEFTPETVPTEYRDPFWEQLASFQEYHRRMYAKYEHAARYPWLPVEPDPPAPATPQFRGTHYYPTEGILKETTLKGTVVGTGVFLVARLRLPSPISANDLVGIHETIEQFADQPFHAELKVRYEGMQSKTQKRLVAAIILGFASIALADWKWTGGRNIDSADGF